MRVGLRTDGRFGNGPPSIPGAIGTAAHRLLEAATHGEFVSSSGQVDAQGIAERWDSLIDEQIESLDQLASRSAPSRKLWRNYALRRAAAIVAAERICHRQSHRHSTSRGIGHATEAWYQGFGGRLGGRIDLVVVSSRGLEILDYKSGIVTDRTEAGEATGELRASYVRHLLLYAALYYDQQGVWPSRAVVESLVDGQHEFTVVPNEALQAVEAALDLLDRYNRAVETGRIPASPSEQNCLWCPFKPVCDEYLAAATEAWQAPTVTVSTTLVAASSTEPSWVEVSVEGGNHVRGQTIVRSVPSDDAGLVVGHGGKGLSFSDLLRIAGSQDLAFQWSSQCWLWE